MTGRGYVPKHQSGFTLVELLVVILIFGIFAGAVYSLYIAHMKTVIAREEVLDVQQNVRIAMDRLTRDLRMAGFLTSPVIEEDTATMKNYSTTIGIQTASSEATYVSIKEVLQDDKFAVVPPAALDGITPGQDRVSIVRPSTKTQIGGIFDVLSSTSASGRMSISPAAPADDLRVGDMVCKANAYPEMIRYRIDRADTVNGCDKSPCLMRNTEIIAQGIAEIHFAYFLDGTNDSEIKDLDVDDLRRITAIRVTVKGLTSRKPGSNVPQKSRELTSLIKLRNYR